ncbi:intein C-terminal splicing region [Thermoactinomyces sp. DSM 45892]|nr:intein C-terminal splicing region [Thermoactinomyces sp. DSM 45892]
MGEGWVPAKDLRKGDLFETDKGKKLAVDKIVKKKQKATVYNFKVKDFHTYYVSNLKVLTHNTCGVKNTTTKWDIKTDANAKVSYNFHGQKVTAYQDNTAKSYWWAKDTTGHGGSAFKVFDKKRSELHWVADADEYGNFISNKHKSDTGTKIKLR